MVAVDADELLDRLEMVEKKCDSTYAYMSKLEKGIESLAGRLDEQSKLSESIMGYIKAFEADMNVVGDIVDELLEEVGRKED